MIPGGILRDPVEALGHHLQLFLPLGPGLGGGHLLHLLGIALGEGDHAFAHQGNGLVEVVLIDAVPVDAVVLQELHLGVGLGLDGAEALADGPVVVGAEVAHGAAVRMVGALGGGAGAVVALVAVDPVGLGEEAQAVGIPEAGRLQNILGVLGIDEIGIIFPVGDVAALDLPGQGGCAVFGIVRAGAEGGAQGADDDVVVLYPQGDVLVDVLHGFGPQQLAGEVGMGLIELGDETIPGDIHSGRGAAVSLTRFLHAIGDGFELIHDDTSLSADNIPNRQYSTLSANCHLEFHISFCPFGTGGFVDFSLRRGYT